MSSQQTGEHTKSKVEWEDSSETHQAMRWAWSSNNRECVRNRALIKTHIVACGVVSDFSCSKLLVANTELQKCRPYRLQGAGKRCGCAIWRDGRVRDRVDLRPKDISRSGRCAPANDGNASLTVHVTGPILQSGTPPSAESTAQYDKPTDWL